MLFDGLLRKTCRKTIAVVNPSGNKSIKLVFIDHGLKTGLKIGYIFKIVKS